MKPKAQSSKVDRMILEEASDWFVDFRVGDVDVTARERFDEWLRRSPEHIRAYMEIARTYVELPALKVAGKVDVDSLIAYANSRDSVVPFDSAGHVRPHALKTSRHDRATTRERYPRRLLAAAAAIVLSIAGVVWWNAEQHPLYATDIGERRSITLNDGSTVDLNARSKLRIEFSKNERRVELLDGQALFQVAKDKNRPFIVASGAATVRAVGTQFDVYRKDSGTTVTVLEGRVAVYSTTAGGGGSAAPPPAKSRAFSDSPSAAMQLQASARATSHSNAKPPIPTGLTDPSQTAAIFLSAGEQVTVTPAEVLPMPARADIAATTAWMERRLIFDGAKLSDVVQEFNRYNRRQLVIDGTQLSDFHVSGVYSSTDPASLIRFLREQPGLKITEDDNQVLITAR